MTLPGCHLHPRLVPVGPAARVLGFRARRASSRRRRESVTDANHHVIHHPRSVLSRHDHMIAQVSPSYEKFLRGHLAPGWRTIAACLVMTVAPRRMSPLNSVRIRTVTRCAQIPRAPFRCPTGPAKSFGVRNQSPSSKNIGWFTRMQPIQKSCLASVLMSNRCRSGMRTDWSRCAVGLMHDESSRRAGRRVSSPAWLTETKLGHLQTDRALLRQRHYAAAVFDTPRRMETISAASGAPNTPSTPRGLKSVYGDEYSCAGSIAPFSVR